jgi:hypothetical protein
MHMGSAIKASNSLRPKVLLMHRAGLQTMGCMQHHKSASLLPQIDASGNTIPGAAACAVQQTMATLYCQ